MNALFGFLRDFWRELWPVRIIYSYQRGVRFWRGMDTTELLPGVHLVCPYFGDIQTINVREDYIDLVVQSITTKDGKAVTFSANVGFEIVDARAMYCNVQDFQTSLARCATNHLARKIRGWVWEELITEQTALERSLRETLTTRAKRWGVEITDVGLTDFVLAKPFRFFSG